MNLSMNIRYLSEQCGMEQAAAALQKAGIFWLDYTPEMKGDWKTELKRDTEVFEKHGLHVHMGHAPFNRYHDYGKDCTYHKKLVDESLDAAILLKSEYLVVHGDEFDFENMEYSPEKALSYNYDYFAPIVEKAIKNGVCIAFENVFEDMDVPRFCSDEDDLLALIERFNTPEVCCCWDFGHASVAYKLDQPEKIRKMKGHIRCTHVHDNYLDTDSHMIPYFGKIPWNLCMKALNENHHPDALSFELVYGKVPMAATEATAVLLKKLGESLLNEK